MTGYIYKITCLVTNKVYIGQTSETLDKRFKRHIRIALSGSGYYLHSAIRKYGPENFVIEELGSFVAENKQELKVILDEAEKDFIKKFDSFEKGYNLTMGGEGGLGRSLTEETKEKIAKAHLGKKMSESHLRNLRKAMANLSEESRAILRNNKLGTHATEETKEKLRKSHLGKKLSEETRRKLSESKKGRIPSKNTLEAARKYHLGKPMPDNVKEALYKANKGRKLSEEHKRKISEGNKGKKNPLSEATKEKIRQAHLGKRGYHHSEATKEKIRLAHLRRLGLLS